MNKKTGILSIATALVSFVLSASLLSGTVFAGDGLDDCGDNLKTGISYSTYSLDISVDDKALEFSKNTMYDYGFEASPWHDYYDEIYNIHLGYGVYSIGENAFEDFFVETVYIPSTVASIGDNAFTRCYCLKTVYYGGTDLEWDKLSKNTGENNDALLNANIICMDKGELVVDMSDGPFKMDRNVEKALCNTMDYLSLKESWPKQEEPVTCYDVGGSGDFDISLGYDGSDTVTVNNITVDYDVARIVYSTSTDWTSSGGSIFDYCISQVIDSPFASDEFDRSFYSCIKFLFGKTDLGELVVDLRDGSFATDAGAWERTLDAFDTGCTMYYGDALINWVSLDNLVDIDKDGKYDISYSFDTDGNAIIQKLEGLNENKKVSVAGDEGFVIFQMTFDAWNYSTVTVKVKDDVVKVDKKPATCDKDGYEEYWKSTDNDNIYADKDANNKISSPKKIPATGHKFGGWTVTTKATVDKTGVETRTCSVCGKKETRDVAKLTPTPTAKPASSVTLKLDKNSADVICGKTLTLKATLKGATGKIAWKSSDKKIATVDADGKITAKQAGTVTITATAAGKSASCEVTVLYKDVTNTKDFWYAPTNYLTAKGVVKGYDKQTKFKPANDCTRAQMVTFLYRLQGEPDVKSTTCKFSDVKKTDYFFKPVIWAVEKGITTGVSKTKFDPQGVCTRAQTVTFLWRMARKPAPKAKTCKFKDVKEKDYFYKPVIWASEQKIVAGYADGTFKPQGKCLRRQMVTFLYKYDKYVGVK